MRISDWSSDVCSSDLRQIRAFCAVYEEGSISGAAKRLRIAQPNISVAIKNLEFDLCKQMFERSSTGVKPTPVARIFYSRLQPALAHLEAAHHERSEEHTSELQSLMRISYAVFCLKKKQDKP